MAEVALQSLSEWAGYCELGSGRKGMKGSRRKDADINAKKEEIAKTKREKEQMIKEGEAAERGCEEVKKKREAELKKGGKLKKKEEEVAELEKDLVKIKTQADIKKVAISDDKRRWLSLRRKQSRYDG